MADSLEKELVNSKANPGPETGTAIKKDNPGSIDDKFKTTENKTNSIDDKFTWKRFGWDLAKFAPLAYGIYTVVQGTFTPLMTMGGFLLGNLIDSWRNKKKLSYTEIKKDLLTAAVLGASDYWFWTIPNIIPNANLLGKIARTLFAVPLIGIPYFYAYNHALNLRDKYGLKGTLKGILTGKIFSYMKEYHPACKQNVKKQMKQLLYIWPTYFFGMNYLKNIYQKIGVSLFNNMFLRLISSKSAREKSEAKAKTDTRGFYREMYDNGKGLVNKIYTALHNSKESLREKLLNGYEPKYRLAMT